MVNLLNCPHCGFDVGDDEICQGCGALLEEIPVRKTTGSRGIGGLITGLKENTIHAIETTKPSFGDRESTPFFLDEEIEKLHEDS